MEIIKSNKKTLALFGGIAALATGLYVFDKKKRRDGNKNELEFTSAGSPTLTKHNKALVLSKINIEYHKDILGLHTITQIYDAVVEVVTPKFILLTAKDREGRRAHRDDLKEYIKIYKEYTIELDKIVEKARNDVLSGLGIPEFVWNNSISYYMGQENLTLLKLHDFFPQKLKQNLKGSKILQKPQLEQVLMEELDLMSEKMSHSSELHKLLMDPEELKQVARRLVTDQIHDEYGVEAEDVNSSISNYRMDPDINELSLKLRAIQGVKLF